jgi:methanogenic corrinoid protein MtbC1
MWEEDECSFTDVTIGVCRMHEVLLEFSRCFDATGSHGTPGRHILILPSPGEQHTFGLFMVIEFFRRSGWTCFTGTPTTGSEFQQLARASDYDAIGISASAERHIDGAAEQIAKIRSQPRTSDVVIIAGGRAFLDNPDLAREIGADAMAIDAEDAVHKLNRMCRAKSGKKAR